MKVIPEIRTSVSVMDSEDLVDMAYNGLVSCLSWILKDSDRSIPARVVTGTKNAEKELEHFEWGVSGVYIPGSKRNYWYGSFDLDVDEVPEHCCVYTDLYDTSSFEYTVVTQIKRFPAHVSCGCKDKHVVYRFKTTYVIMPDTGPEPKFTDPIIHVSYFAIDKTGAVWTAIDTRKFREWRPHEVCLFDERDGSHLGPGALSLTADQKYLWLIKTSEPTEWKTEAKMVFGVEEPLVKSLFFARDLPLTETGRKKPILHWVSAHKRRIQECVEIDVSKYLRGIERIEMGNIKFEITQPRKDPER